MIVPAAKAAVLFFFVTIVQVTIVSEIGILGGSPDLVLVTLVAVALTQGSIFGAVTGFWAGLLLDVARLGTLGFCSRSPGSGSAATARPRDAIARTRRFCPSPS